MNPRLSTSFSRRCRFGGWWCLAVWMLGVTLAAEESWQSALARMPLAGRVTQLDKTNCVRPMLSAFQSNAVVKALIFMPAATDELYFFDRVHARLTNAAPSLLDAVTALTNQTRIHATYRRPFLLLHRDDEWLEPWFEVVDEPTAALLKQKPFIPSVLYNDRNWDYLQPALTRTLAVTFMPGVDAPDSWHFYRASLAGWNLNGAEALEAISLATRTSFSVRRRAVVFELITREQLLRRLGK